MKRTVYNAKGHAITCMVPPKYDNPIDNFSPADQGIIAATLEDVAHLGDDDRCRALTEILELEDIRLMRSTTYAETAYYIVHG